MIFLRYESFRGYLRMFPVTSVIIAINLVVFFYDKWIGGGALIERGAFFENPVDDPYGLKEPWRYVTSIFLHGGYEHLFFNLFAILVFAPPLERMLKSGRYALFYLLCGIAANAFSAVIHTDYLASVGASGAIYGVYGAYLYLATMKKTLDEASRKTVYTILVFGIIYSVVAQGINLWAHVGGGIAGFLFAYIYDRSLSARRN
ncbi:rhomboid family intramembrane serine protease [Paenibacillus mendelii]|uniref:Rhomboid family intramembrane serine protease n=1 Tax=Paenibacillus mendelii TaxID=206163 RepID=A0ABV6JBH1_9BACL|nr:rhomboid family intramembrane serine protease [Paenibacillus mendelii]MCQ6558502.1 rhomboid family intramembrane serine protease [Paenibacillus mendelii]